MSRFERKVQRHGRKPAGQTRKGDWHPKSSKRRQQKWTQTEVISKPSGKLDITVTRPADHGKTEVSAIERIMAAATMDRKRFLEDFLAKAAEGADLKRPERAYRRNGLLMQGKLSNV